MSAFEDDDALDRRVITSTGEERREAFAEIWRRKRLLFLARAHRLTGDWHRAEEVVAEASAKTWRAIVAGRGPRESVTGYLLLAVQNEATRANSGHRAVSSVDDEYFTGLVDEQEEHASEARDEHDLLDRAFRSLPADWQRVLGLTIVEERTLASAAAALGLSLSAATSLAHRAREGLRVAYLQQYVEHAAPGCEKVAGELGRYARGTLNPTARTRVERHIATCADCTRQLDRLARMNTSLRAWLGPVIVGSGVGAGAASLGWGSGAVEAALLLLTRPALLMGVAAAVLVGLIVVVATVLTPIPRPLAGSEPTPSASISATIVTEPTASTGGEVTPTSPPDPRPTPSVPRATLVPDPVPTSTPAPTDTQPRPPQRTTGPVPEPSESAPVSPPTSGPTAGPTTAPTPSVPVPTPSPPPREDDTTEFWIIIER